MSITENVRELIGIVNEICKDRNLDIKEIIEKEDHTQFNSIWNEAISIFFKTDIKEIDINACSKCKNHDDKVKKIEDFIEQKKYEMKFKNEETQSGVITGLEMALAILI